MGLLFIKRRHKPPGSLLQTSSFPNRKPEFPRRVHKTPPVFLQSAAVFLKTPAVFLEPPSPIAEWDGLQQGMRARN